MIFIQISKDATFAVLVFNNFEVEDCELLLEQKYGTSTLAKDGQTMKNPVYVEMKHINPAIKVCHLLIGGSLSKTSS